MQRISLDSSWKEIYRVDRSYWYRAIGIPAGLFFLFLSFWILRVETNSSNLSYHTRTDQGAAALMIFVPIFCAYYFIQSVRDRFSKAIIQEGKIKISGQEVSSVEKSRLDSLLFNRKKLGFVYGLKVDLKALWKASKTERLVQVVSTPHRKHILQIFIKVDK